MAASNGEQESTVSQTPTLAAAPKEVAGDIVRPELQPMPAVAPGTSIATMSEVDSNGDNTSVASKSPDAATSAASDWRPSKRRRKPAAMQKAKESKIDNTELAENGEPTSRAASRDQSEQSENRAGEAIVKIERAIKPTPAVIVPLADPLPAAPSPAADRDGETPLNNARNIDTAVKRSSAIEPESDAPSPAVATDTPQKRRPVIIRPEKLDAVTSHRSNPVRIVRGDSESQPGPVADVSDDEEGAEPAEAVVSGPAKTARSPRSATRGFDPNVGRRNPLR